VDGFLIENKLVPFCSPKENDEVKMYVVFKKLHTRIGICEGWEIDIHPPGNLKLNL